MAELQEFISKTADEQINKVLNFLGLAPPAFNALGGAIDKAATTFDKLLDRLVEIDKVLHQNNITKVKTINAANKLASINNEVVKTSAKLTTAYSKENKKLIEKKTKLAETNKELRDNAKAQLEVEKRQKAGIADAAKISGAYDQLSKKLKDQVKLSRDLAVTYGTNSEQYKAAAAEVRVLERQLDIQLKTEKKLTAVEKEKISVQNQLAKSSAKLTVTSSRQGKQLAENRSKQAQLNKQSRLSIALNSAIEGSYKHIAASLALNIERWKSLSLAERENSSEGKKLLAIIIKQEKALAELNNELGRAPKNTAESSKSFLTLGGTLLKAFGIIGTASFIVGEIRKIASESRKLATEARGVDFAFKRVGNSSKVFDRVKKATRGLLSNLDIKRSIVEFDNFSLSVKELPQLLEFVAIRASQTGKSFDKLKDSLIEGLSKESKLRIDNLGISTKDLNDELDRTPNFLKAVANIAKREVKEAGDVIGAAANQQQRYNAAVANAKITFGNFLNNILNPFISGFAGIITHMASAEKATVSTSERFDDLRSKANGLFGALGNLNEKLSNLEEGTEDYNVVAAAKKQVLGDINRKYGEYLPNLLTEKSTIEDITVAQEALNKELFKKQLIISFQEEINKALKEEIDARTRLARAEVFEASGGVDKDKSDLLNEGASPGQAKAFAETLEVFGEISKKANEQAVADAQETQVKISKTYSTLAESIGISYEEFLGLVGESAEKAKKILEPPPPPELKGIELLRDEQNKLKKSIEDAALAGKDFNESLLLYEKNAKKISKIESIFNPEEIKDQTEALDEYKKALSDYYQQAFDNAKARAEERKQIASAQADFEVAAIMRVAKREENIQKVRLAEGKITQKEFNDIIFKSQKVYIKSELETLEIELENLDKSLGNFKLTEIRKLEIKRDIEKQKQDLDDLTTDNAIANAQHQSSIEEARRQAIIKGIKLISSTIQELADRDLESRHEAYDRELERVTNNTDHQISELQRQKEEGTITEEAFNVQKEELDQRREAKERQIKIKKAKADKEAALFSVALNTAAAVLKGIAQMGPPPNPVGIAAIAAAIATGAIQAGLILSKPLPKFGKGTKSAPEGRALVGEAGRELMIHPSGGMEIVHGPSIRHLTEGTVIKNNLETEQILRAANLGVKQTDNSELIASNREIVKAVKNQKTVQLNYRKGNITDRRGSHHKNHHNRIAS